MVRVIEGDLQGQGVKVSIVVSRFNSFITDRLLEGALDALKRHGVDEKAITVVKVPGSFEIPLGVRRAAGTKVDMRLGLYSPSGGARPQLDGLDDGTRRIRLCGSGSTHLRHVSTVGTQSSTDETADTGVHRSRLPDLGRRLSFDGGRATTLQPSSDDAFGGSRQGRGRLGHAERAFKRSDASLRRRSGSE